MATLPVLPPTLQLGFFQRLKEAEETHLLPALLKTAGALDIALLDQELLKFAGREKLSFMARRGMRGELVFPVPCLLSARPTLLGYYRLLLGFSQKEFYHGPFSRFQRMEKNAVLTPATASLLPSLCESLIESGWLLVNGLPEISQEILQSLTLLTLGPQFRGSRNVTLGTESIQTVFALIKAIASEHIEQEEPSCLEVRSVAGRVYRVEFAPDPDIAIRQVLEGGSTRNRIAIEIKGGTDYSNIHNRLGEAEKSHQKARAEGFTQFWTIVNVSALGAAVWKQETPTTNELFYLEQIADVGSAEHKRFREYLVSELGI